MKEKDIKKAERKPKQSKNVAAQSRKPILSAKQAAKLMRDDRIRKRKAEVAERTQASIDETEYAIDNIEETAYTVVDEVKIKSAKEVKPEATQRPQTARQKRQMPKRKLKEKPAYTTKTLEKDLNVDIKPERQEPKSKPSTAIIKEKNTPLPEETPRQGVVCDIPTKPAIKEKIVLGNRWNQQRIVRQNAAQFEPYFEPIQTEDNLPAESYAEPKDISLKIKPVSIAPKTRGAVYEKKPVASKQQTFGREKTAVKLTPKPVGKAKEQMRRQAIRKAQKAAGVSVELGERAVRFVARTTTAVAKPLAAMLGGGIVLIILAAVVLIAAVASSPFGLLLAGERSAAGAVSLAEAVASVNVDYNAKLEALQEGDYIGIEITGQAAAWPDVLATFAVKVAGADSGGLDVVTLDSRRVELLKSVFWDMTDIQTETENDANGEILKITITAKSAEDMRTVYAFSDYQNGALDELLAESSALIALSGSLDIANVDALAVFAALPDDLPEKRRNVVQTALTLYGKVNYFWGGKSLAIGWDSRWGELRKVTAAGSRTTGSYRPFGLDCSGYVDWVFYNATYNAPGGGYIIGHGGGAASQHNYCTDISWAEAMPGDLVFYLEDDHVGIVCGWDDSGNLLVIHCASSANNVVITGASGFSFVARPNYYSD